MNRMTHTLLAALLAAVALPAQERDRTAVWRDFSSVQRLRVVCDKRHFGRIDDLIAEVPSGKLAAAVVTMTLDQGPRTVMVPFANLRYDAQTNLLQIEPCMDADDLYPAFDAAKVATTRTGDGNDAVLTGTVLVNRLLRSEVALQGEAKATAQGLTVELRSGHVAFVDVAARERAGDNELHPVPWSALRLAADDGAGGKAPVLGLARTKEALAATPTLVEIIVQDPLYRARVYECFEVRRPEYDTDG